MWPASMRDTYKINYVVNNQVLCKDSVKCHFAHRGRGKTKEEDSKERGCRRVILIIIVTGEASGLLELDSSSSIPLC